MFSSDRNMLAMQAEILRNMSCLFSQPDIHFLKIIANLRLLYLDSEDAKAVALLDDLSEDLEREDAIALQVDYAKLFVGPFEMLAPPYASLYLEAGDQVNGEVTQAIFEIYQAQGVILNDNEKMPIDHIGYLLEFLYYLAFQYLKEKDEKLYFGMNQFAESYLLSWKDEFFALMGRGASTQFYRCLGRLGLLYFPV